MPSSLAYLIPALFVLVSSENPHSWASSRGKEPDSLQRELEVAVLQTAMQTLERDALHELFAHPEGLPTGASVFESKIIGNGDIAIRKSSIPKADRGAFANRQFENGQLIREYKCILEGSDGPAFKTTSKYKWLVNATHVCDAISIPLYNPARYVNSIVSAETCHKKNADVRISPSGGVFYVASKPIMEGEEILVDYGMSYFQDTVFSYECHMTQLQRFSARGDTEAVRALLADHQVRGAIDASDSFGWTALMLACEAGHLEVVKLLAEAGSDVSHQASSVTLSTPLHVAADNGHAGIVKYLSGFSKTNVNTEMARGFTPLMVAAGKGHINVVEELVQSGAYVAKALENGYTALTLAWRNGHTKVTRALLEAGARQNKTALTSMKGFQRVIKELKDSEKK